MPVITKTPPAEARGAPPQKRARCAYNSYSDDSDYSDISDYSDYSGDDYSSDAHPTASPSPSPPPMRPPPPTRLLSLEDVRHQLTTLGFPNAQSLVVLPPAEDVRKTYRRSALAAHPDKGGSKEQFQNLQNAYETVVKAYTLS